MDGAKFGAPGLWRLNARGSPSQEPYLNCIVRLVSARVKQGRSGQAAALCQRAGACPGRFCGRAGICDLMTRRNRGALRAARG